MKNLSLKWVVIGQVALAGVVVSGVSLQIQKVRQKTIAMADLKDPSPFTNILDGYLSRVNFGLLTYLHLPNAPTGTQITQAETHFEDALNQFHKENPRLLPLQVQAKIAEAFVPFKETAGELLAMNDEQSRNWNLLSTTQSDLMTRLEFRLRPLIRHQQGGYFLRGDIISSLQNEVRAVPGTVARGFMEGISMTDVTRRADARARKFFELYAPLIQTPAERRDFIVCRRLWDGMQQAAMNLSALEGRKTEAFARFGTAYETLQRTISMLLPPVPPDVLQNKKDALLRAIQWMIAGAALLLIIGVGSCLGTGIWMFRRIQEALKEIEIVTEAAVKGDLSREAGSTTRSLDPMANSVNRLIAVMRRSEQLILQLGSIVESSGDASIGLTLDGTMLSWNRAAQRIYSYALDEIKGKSVEMLFPANRGVQFTEMLMALHEKRVISLETIHLRRSGVPINVRLIMTHILDSNGHAIGLSLLARDLGLISHSNPSSIKAA